MVEKRKILNLRTNFKKHEQESKKLIIETNGQRTEIDYASLSLPEINKRFRAYEKNITLLS